MGLKDVKAATHEILDSAVVSFLLTEASEYLTTYAWASLVAQMVKNLPAMQEDPGAIPGLERSPGEGNGNPLQYSCLENPHGQRSLVGYSPWGLKESDTTE